MKQTFLRFAALSLLVIGAASCEKEYTCTCTYVPDFSSAGQSNKVETTTVEATSKNWAEIECFDYEMKYWDHTGTCTASR